MKRSEMWQHPFVEVFKLVNIGEWRVAQKEGDVTECLDRVTGKRVFRIAGAVSAANSIQIPRAKSQLKTLGLTGKYLYIQMHSPPSKLFSQHYEFVLKNAKTKSEEVMRVSLSNIFKETKATSAGIQVALHLSEKWSVVVLSVPGLLEHFYPGTFLSHTLRSFTLCSSMYVRGVFTSDNLYTPQSLPREMALKIGKDQRWTEVYDWVTFFCEETKKEESKQPSKKRPSTAKKPSKVTEESPQLPEPPKEPQKELSESLRKPQLPESPKESPKKPQELPKTKTEFDSRTKFKLEQIESQLKKTGPKETSSKPTSKSVNFEKPAQEGTPFPDPIVQLAQVIGYTSSRSNAKWTRLNTNLTCYPPDFVTPGANYLIYPSGCTLVMLNTDNKKQHFMFGHTQSINCLDISDDGSMVATGQEGKNPLCLVWELKTMRAPTFINLANFNGVKSVGFSNDNKFLVTAGTDSKAREIIIVWDVSCINQSQKPQILAKQISHFHINTIKFSPIDNQRLVSCGKENIRFWRINKDHLSGAAVVLNHHARSSEFLDLCFEVFISTAKSKVANENLKRVFVGSSQGMVFQVNYHSMDLEGVFQLHDGAIEAIAASEGFCVTGSADCFLRIWPLDFSEVYLEAHHEAPVTSVDITQDSLKVTCGTSNSTIGVLDMTTNAYRTILRSHTREIVALDAHPSLPYLVTASKDNTIRIWSTETFDEQYEFCSPQDPPLSLSFHPLTNYFACGFKSGTLRVFNVEATAVQEEYMQHENSVLKAVHSSDARLLLTASEDASVCLYDPRNKYQPVKTISSEVPGEYVDACFSFDSKLFAVLGSNYSSISIWDSETFSLKYRVNPTGVNLQKIQFSPNGQDILAISKAKTSKVRFYSLSGYEATQSRELSDLHASDILSFGISPNSKYLVTGGVDRILKVWDYSSTQKRGQAFIGHSGEVCITAFSSKGEYLISCGDALDGIFIWQFNGDKTPLEPVQKTQSEKVKIIEEESINEIFSEVEPKAQKKGDFLQPLSPEKYVEEPSFLKPGEAKLRLSKVNCFNVPGPSNLHWAPEEGWFVYTSGKNLIKTDLRAGNTQVCLEGVQKDLYCLAVSPNCKLVAGASRSPQDFNSSILLWDLETSTLIRKLSFHEKGVEALEFSKCGGYLISAGISEEPVLVVWEVVTGKVIATSLLEEPVARIKCLEDLHFLTLGTSLMQWRLAPSMSLEYIQISSGDYSALDYYSNQIYVGTSDGRVLVWNLDTSELESEHLLIGEKINVISCKSERIVIGGDSNHLMSWKANRNMLKTEPEVILLDNFINSVSFESAGNEGLVSTTSGTIWYINWEEKASLRVLSSHTNSINTLAVGPLIATAGKDNCIRLWETSELNEVTQHKNSEECLALKFHSSLPLLAAGFSSGTLRFYNTSSFSCIAKSQPFSNSITAMAWDQDLYIGSQTGVVSSISCSSWEQLDLCQSEVGMAGGGVKSLDCQPGMVVGSTDIGKFTVWENQTPLDIFNVFQNPHGEEVDQSQDSLQYTLKLYQQLGQVETSVKFVDSERIACTSSALQYLFIRNFRSQEIEKRIVLSHFPTCLETIGEVLVMGTDDKLVVVYDLETQETQEYSSHSYALKHISCVEGTFVTTADKEFIAWKFLN